MFYCKKEKGHETAFMGFKCKQVKVTCTIAVLTPNQKKRKLNFICKVISGLLFIGFTFIFSNCLLSCNATYAPFRYLEDAVMFLDPSQPTSSEHIPNVVGGLISSLQSCDAHGGDPRKIKTIRMLIMAGKSLLS